MTATSATAESMVEDQPKLGTIKNLVQNDILRLDQSKQTMPTPDENNWQDVLTHIQILFSEEYEEDQICIEIVDKQIFYRFGTLGNFSMIIGKAKSRKTFFLTLLIAAILGKFYGNKFRVTLPVGKKKVLHFDTEQSKSDVGKVARKVKRMIGIDPSGEYQVYSARVLAPPERLFMLEKLIYNTEDLGIVIIDGVRDLLYDINDLKEVSELVTKLMKWTEERHIHIITILHQNKADTNARGHLGTEMVNKAETTISLEKDEHFSKVKPEYMRGRDFPDFAFGVDADELAYIVSDEAGASKQEGKIQKTDSPFDMDNQTHFNILNDVFSKGDSFKYNDLLIQIKLSLASCGITIGNNKVRIFIKHYENRKWLEEFKPDKGRYNEYRKTSKIQAC